MACCRYAVVSAEQIQVLHPENEHAAARVLEQPPITRVCSIIRAETLSIFYRQNVFCFVDDTSKYMHALFGWLRVMIPSHWRLLSNCIVRSRHGGVTQSHINYGLKQVFGGRELQVKCLRPPQDADDSDWDGSTFRLVIEGVAEPRCERETREDDNG